MSIARLLVAVLALGIFLEGQAAANAEPSEKMAVDSRTAPANSPDVATRRFLRALKESDRAAFLSCLSRKTPLRWLNYMAIGPEPSLITYNEIAASFREKTDYYYSFLVREDADGVKGAYDCFADHASGAMWKKHGEATFFPPGEVKPHRTGPYVRWKKEAGRWVIAEIAYSTA